MPSRLPLVLSATSLVVAVLGTTPLGALAKDAAFPRNSITSLQLNRGAVTAAKIAPNAVRTAHVLDGSLLAADFKPGQLPQGPKGDKGDKGDRGDRGEKGEPATRFWAAVNPDGTIRQASGVKAVTKISKAVNTYSVEFREPMGDCAITAEPNEDYLTSTRVFPTGPTTVQVKIDNLSNAPTPNGYRFSVAAFC